MLHRKLRYFCFLLLGVFAAGLVHARTIEKSYDVKSGGTLYLESDRGSLKVESHALNKVEVEVKIRNSSKEDFEVDISKNGNDVKIIGESKSGKFIKSISVQYIVKVPEKYNVNLKTGGGSIQLGDLTGNAEAHTSGGSIRVGRIVGKVDVNTSGGSINIAEVAGTVNANTSGGSVIARISEQPDSDCKLRTSGGSVTAYLSPSIAVDLNARTSGGRVSSDFEVDGMVDKKHIKGTINGGGPKLDLKTSGGSVRVKSL